MHVFTNPSTGPVGRGCKIHRLYLCRRVRLPASNECPGYNTKQSDAEAQVVLKLWKMRNTSLLPLIPGPFWPVVVAPDGILSMGQIELFDIETVYWG